MSRPVKGRRPVPDEDGRASRWDDHRESRRTQLVAAATEAIDQYGPNASIAQIAATAGVSKPVLYRYFQDKNDLYAAVGQWGAGELLDRLVPVITGPGTIREKTYLGCTAYLSFLDEHPQVFLLLVEHRIADDPLADGKAKVAATFARVIGDVLRKNDLDAGGAEPWAHGLVGLGLSIGEWWLRRRMMSLEAASSYLGDFVWHAFSGIAAEHGVRLDTDGSLHLVEPDTATRAAGSRSRRSRPESSRE